MRLTFLLVTLLTWLSAAPSFAASTTTQDNSKTSLVSPATSIKPGQKTVLVGLLIEPREGWHIYWENPGDSGLAPSLAWTLPAGVTAGDIDWPLPKVIHEGPLATYSYEDATLLPVQLTLPEDQAGEINIKLHTELLVCHDICVPESADLDLTLPVSDDLPQVSPHAEIFKQHSANRPSKLETPIEATWNDDTLTLTLPGQVLAGKDNDELLTGHFFPREFNIIQYPAPQSLTISKQSAQLSIPLAKDGNKPPRLSGFLSLTLKDGSQKNLSITTTPDEHASALEEAQSPAVPGMLLSAALLLAFTGGIILNLMPCVLPVLSLKALALAKKSGSEHSHVVRQGIAYTFGILCSFGALSAVLLVLRAGGESVGWGYQMQSPSFVASLAFLLFLVGLNLSGLFHLPVLLGNVGGKLASENSAKGSFFTGMLATAVATPCTAPFMAPAIGAALAMDTWQALLIFQALGLGLALPFLLISLFPALRSFLPKPGAWMDTFKQLMAFPMYASVIWLIWVLTLQCGVTGMVILLSGMLAAVFIIWMRCLFPPESAAYPKIAVLLFAGLILSVIPKVCGIETQPSMPATKENVTIIPYNKNELTTLLSQKKPVFVDATAAWCITCQVNAKVALHTPRVMKKFEELGITLMIADWTRRNTEITEFLASFGFNGVPLNVYYPPGGKPIVLPQLLSEDIVLQTLTPTGVTP